MYRLRGLVCQTHYKGSLVNAAAAVSRDTAAFTRLLQRVSMLGLTTTLLPCMHILWPPNQSAVQCGSQTMDSVTVNCVTLLPSVLKNGLCPLARQLCKGGCPIGLRRELWSKALAIETNNQEV